MSFGYIFLFTFLCHPAFICSTENSKTDYFLSLANPTLILTPLFRNGLISPKKQSARKIYQRFTLFSRLKSFFNAGQIGGC